MTHKAIEDISKILKDNANCILFIKDYILRFRFADISSHTKNTESYIEGKAKLDTTENIHKKYTKDAEKIIKDYEDEVKRICDKDNVQTCCENDQLMKLKEDLDNAKKLAFDKILKQYDNIDSYSYTNGVPSDFMLYTFYLSYITSDEFVYDTENPYIVELFDKIITYLNVRSKIELNKTNIEALIIDFNKLCDANIKKYWDKSKKDYFSEIKSIFQFDFYTTSSNELIEAKINDEKRVTLYSKVLDYLKVLTKYVEPLSAEEKYADANPNDIINLGTDTETSAEKENKEKLKQLKRIALTFVALKRIESETNTTYFKEYIDETNLNDALTLKNSTSSTKMTIDEIATSTTYKNSKNKEIVKKYTGMLEGVTRKEAKELRELSDKAIQWYKENSERIDSGSLFYEQREINWAPATKINKDDTPHDFFFLEESVDISPDGTNNTNNQSSNSNDILKDYEYTEDSLRTKYGIDDIRYWLRYCTVATLVNCMLPMYWSTGLLIAGAPMKLPIIFIPIIVFSSRVILVLGIGLCGICPMPMIILMNVSDIPGFAIPILNVVVDTLKGVSAMVMNLGKKSVKELIKVAIQKEDDNINKINEEIKSIETNITNLKNGVGTDMETLRSLRKANKEDTTTKGKTNKQKKSGRK